MRVYIALLNLFLPQALLAANPDSVHRSGLEACPTPAQYCPDVDQDNFGDTAFCIVGCEPPYDFFLSSGGDCNNNSALINPNGTEICNGLDDDCDTTIDENNPGGGGTCSTSFPGVCSIGTRTCSNGALICMPDIAPGSQTEQCNGFDDNCNGQNDEGNPGGGGACVVAGFVGICQFGTLQCSSPNLVCIGPQPGTVQETCNGQDDDCNGTIDDPALLNNIPCNSGFPGVCSNGRTMCGGGNLSCQPLIAPGQQAEICDTQDNDCDGLVDEDFPGLGGDCPTGLPAACSVGTLVCGGGVSVCQPPNGC